MMESLGTCQIKIQASGKFLEDHPEANIVLFATPRGIRGSAMSAIEKCAGNDDPRSPNKGGFATYHLANVIDWITAPNTVFPGNLQLDPDLTFFTAMVWNYDPRSPDIEPGSHDEETAYVIARELDKSAEVAPSRSPLRTDLQARARYVHGSEYAINDHGGLGSGLAWWSGPVDASSWGTHNSSLSGACAGRVRLRLPQAVGCNITSTPGTVNVA